MAIRKVESTFGLYRIFVDTKKLSAEDRAAVSERIQKEAGQFFGGHPSYFRLVDQLAEHDYVDVFVRYVTGDAIELEITNLVDMCQADRGMFIDVGSPEEPVVVIFSRHDWNPTLKLETYMAYMFEQKKRYDKSLAKLAKDLDQAAILGVIKQTKFPIGEVRTLIDNANSSWPNQQQALDTIESKTQRFTHPGAMSFLTGVYDCFDSNSHKFDKDQRCASVDTCGAELTSHLAGMIKAVFTNQKVADLDFDPADVSNVSMRAVTYPAGFYISLEFLSGREDLDIHISM